MKVLLINSMCGNGSTGRIVADLYGKLINEGHSAKVAYGLGTATIVPEEDTYRINNRIGYYFHNVLAKFSDRTGLYSSLATKHFINWIDEYDPDIVHLHNLHGYYINYKLLFEYLILRNKKVVWTLHDCWSFTGHCAHFDRVNCDKWLSGCVGCSHLNLYPKSYFISRSNSNFRIKEALFGRAKNLDIVCPSEWLAKLAERSFLGSHPVRVINNGIDLSKFFPERGKACTKYGFEGKRVLLGVASNWNHAKGFDDFLRLSHMIGNDTVIVLVGVSEQQKREFGNRIIGINKTDSFDELRALYSDADVFLNLTYEDTFPTVNMEALACGTPVITYATGGSSEIIDHVCGRAVIPGDLDSVLTCINECVLINRSNCTSRATYYNKLEKYKEYMYLYRELIGNDMEK